MTNQTEIKPWILIPPIVYRYMDQEYIDDFFSTGNLMLSCIKICKKIEIDTIRQDKLEGTDLLFLNSSDRQIGIYQTQDLNAHILCTSVKEDESFLREDKFNCTGYFKILDTHLFGKAILNSINNSIQGFEGYIEYLDHKIIKRSIPKLSLDDLKDVNDPNKISLDNIMSLSNKHSNLGVFRKPRLFEWQQEYRFAWFTDKIVNEYNFVKCPDGKNGQSDPFPPILIDHPDAGLI